MTEGALACFQRRLLRVLDLLVRHRRGHVHAYIGAHATRGLWFRNKGQAWCSRKRCLALETRLLVRAEMHQVWYHTEEEKGGEGGEFEDEATTTAFECCRYKITSEERGGDRKRLAMCDLQ